MDRVSIIIPAFNEETRIKDTIAAVKNIADIFEIIVVDDGSKDKTAEIAGSAGAKVVRHSKNKGKGQALLNGVVNCTGDIIVFLDGDTGASAREVEKLIIPIKNHNYDMSIAKFKSSGKKGGFGIVKAVSRYGIKLICGQNVETVISGQRAFRADIIRDVKFNNGYGAEVGMTIDILKKGCSFCEIEVDMTHRETGRDIKGFVHRGRQLFHITKALFAKRREY